MAVYWAVHWAVSKDVEMAAGSVDDWADSWDASQAVYSAASSVAYVNRNDVLVDVR